MIKKRIVTKEVEDRFCDVCGSDSCFEKCHICGRDICRLCKKSIYATDYCEVNVDFCITCWDIREIFQNEIYEFECKQTEERESFVKEVEDRWKQKSAEYRKERGSKNEGCC